MVFKKKRNSLDPLIVEKHEYVFYIQNLRRGDIVFDVGANIGELTLLFSRFVGADGQVHAFEPTPSTFDKLTRILDYAGKTSVKLNNMAISNKKGNVNFHVYNDLFASFNSMAKRPLEKYGVDIIAPNSICVPCTTIDSYCKEYGINRIDVLKIDVEGAELNVLEGASKMFSEKRIGVCVFEFGQTIFDMGNTIDQFRVFFEKYGYKIRNVSPEQKTFPIDEKTGWGCFSVLYARPE